MGREITLMASGCFAVYRGCVVNIVALLFVLIALTAPAQEPAGEKAFFPVLEPPVVAQNFPAIAPGTATPPDTNGAVGPNHLFVALNGTVRIQDRAGTVISSTSLLSFWSGMGVSDVFDPRSYFDPHSQRFFFIACAERRSAGSSMLLAVSATDDPTGAWNRWRLDADPTNVNWVDYPNLGFTYDEITFTGNMFSVAADVFGGVRFWRVNKASALAGGSLTVEDFLVTGAGGTLVPVSTFDSYEPTQYVIRTGSSNLFGTGRMQLYSVAGALGSSIVSVASSAAVGAGWSASLPGAPQLGTSSLIATNDDRVLSAVYQDSRIWCAHTVALPASGPARTAAKWWEVFPATGQARQEGSLEDPSGGTFYYFPSLVVNDQGLTMLGCSGSSPSEYVSTYYAWRNPDSPLGTLEGVQQYHAGVGTYTGPRWGDYSGTYLDPVDGTSVWVLQQYAEVSNRWGIQWAQLTINQLNTLPIGSVAVSILVVFLVACGAVLICRRFAPNTRDQR